MRSNVNDDAGVEGVEAVGNEGERERGGGRGRGSEEIGGET